MSIPKVAGIETEYGIMIVGADDPDPFTASREVLDAYQHVGNAAVSCHPYSTGELPASNSEAHSAGINGPHTQRYAFNTADLMLANGARFYIDHGHPEYSTPECLSPHLLVVADKAGERIVAACQRWANDARIRDQKKRILTYKNNSDYKDHSYGCHENYLLSAEFFTNLLHYRQHEIFRYILPFLVTRLLFCGSGKVGSENSTPPVGYQLSQRADFFEALIGWQTTEQRPLFNTRDEAHADPARFRRLHVIVGDANMAECSTYLKVGTMQLVLQMIEDEFLQEDLALASPLAALRIVSRDLTFQRPLFLEDGRQMTALDIQWKFLEYTRQYLTEKESNEEQWSVLEEWEDTLKMLPHQWQKLATRLDWAIKKRLLERYISAQGVTWEEQAEWQPVIEAADSKEVAKEMARHAALTWSDYEKQRAVYFALRRLNLEYHDIRYDTRQEEVGLFYRLQQLGAIERLSTDEEIKLLVSTPPEDTRSWLRGHCIERFAANILSADWSGISFAASAGCRQRNVELPLPDPLAGTHTQLAATWHQVQNPLQIKREQ